MFAFLQTLVGLCFRNSMGFSFQEVTCTGISLARAPGPSTKITVSTFSISQNKLRVPAMGALQLLWLKSLPDVWNRIKIPGMSSLLASSITAAQTPPLRASPRPQPCRTAFDASTLADGQAQQRALLAGGRTADGWAWPCCRAEPSQL